jgi:hypothetical protein
MHYIQSHYLIKWSGKVILLLILGILAIPLQLAKAQTGGNNTYEFLNLPYNARMAGLGHNLVMAYDYDLGIAFYNPSLLNKEMSHQLSLNYCNYVADINYGLIGYAIDKGHLGTFAGGIQYINYGQFTRTDPTSAVLGDFSAGEYAFHLSYGKKIDSVFSIGGNLKTILSSMGGFNSFGFAADFGATYLHPNKLFVASFMARNIGFQAKSYTSSRENLPLEVQAGVSQRFAHMPLRLSFVLKNMERWDLSFQQPGSAQTIDPVTGEIREPGRRIGHKIMLHTGYSAEFLLTKHFNLRFGYNYIRRSELAIDTRPGMTGFSLGFGLKLSKFIINYGRNFQHLAGSGNYFSLAMNMNEFKSKQNRK